MYSSNGVSFKGSGNGRQTLSGLRQFQGLITKIDISSASYGICCILVIPDCKEFQNLEPATPKQN